MIIMEETTKYTLHTLGTIKTTHVCTRNVRQINPNSILLGYIVYWVWNMDK